MYQKEVSEYRNVTVQKSEEPLLSSSIRDRHKSGLLKLWELTPRHSATGLPQHKLVCLNNNAMSLNEFLRLLRPCFTHIETAAFARIETHVYGTVPAKVECNGAD